MPRTRRARQPGSASLTFRFAMGGKGIRAICVFCKLLATLDRAQREGPDMTKAETARGLIARLRSLTVEDAADVLDDAQVSDPLSAEDVLAIYHWMLDRVIGEEP